MPNAQDFDGVSLGPVNDEVRRALHAPMSSTRNQPWPADIGCLHQLTARLQDAVRHRLCCEWAFTSDIGLRLVEVNERLDRPFKSMHPHPIWRKPGERPLRWRIHPYRQP